MTTRPAPIRPLLAAIAVALLLVLAPSAWADPAGAPPCQSAGEATPAWASTGSQAAWLDPVVAEPSPQTGGAPVLRYTPPPFFLLTFGQQLDFHFPFTPASTLLSLVRDQRMILPSGPAGVSWTPMPSDTLFAPPQDGGTLVVYASDAAGHRETWVASLLVLLPGTPPPSLPVPLPLTCGPPAPCALATTQLARDLARLRRVRQIADRAARTATRRRARAAGTTLVRLLTADRRSRASACATKP
jgi:hypothetical protein